MVETSPSLLDRLSRRPDDADWRRLVALYTPLLHAWLGRHGLSAVRPRRPDAGGPRRRRAEIAGVPAQPPRRRFPRLAADDHRPLSAPLLAREAIPGDGAGRRRLRGVPWAAGRSRKWTEREWDREHNQRLLRRLLELVEPEFQAKTWQAFRLLVLERRSAAEAAAELGLTVNAVLIAKSRVLQRMRQEADGLID